MSDDLTPIVFPRNVQFFRELSPFACSPGGDRTKGLGRNDSEGIERKGSNEGDRTKGLERKGSGERARRGSNERARSQRIEK